jgi:xylulokinase
VFLGVDIGTSSSKGVLVAHDGKILGRAERAHGVSMPKPGWVEQDAEAVWWTDFVAVIRQLLDTGAEPEALGLSGIGPCLLPTTATGSPLRPAILYGIDTRATTEVEELNNEFGVEAVVARGGSRLSSQALGPRLRWLARHEPEVYSSTKMLLMASSYLIYRLTGRYILDHHSASQCNPLYDLVRQEWATDLIDRIAPSIDMPELFWPNEVVGYVRPEAATETGLPVGLPVTAGTIDAWAEATSVGVSMPGDTMVMYGTTMFLMQVMDGPRPHPGLWAVSGTRRGMYLSSAGMATSGAITAWLRELVGGEFGDLATQAADAPPGSRGLLVLPYFAGERTPLFDPDARGIIAGLTTSHGIAELYRAVLEGVGYGVKHNLEAMSEASGRIPRLIPVGGGTRTGLWTKIVSDVTGFPQHLPRETVGACLGDARLAAEAVGVDTSSWNPIADTIEPDLERVELYNDYYRHYRELYDSTVELTHFLAAHQHRASVKGTTT